MPSNSTRLKLRYVYAGALLALLGTVGGGLSLIFFNSDIGEATSLADNKQSIVDQSRRFADQAWASQAEAAAWWAGAKNGDETYANLAAAAKVMNKAARCATLQKPPDDISVCGALPHNSPPTGAKVCPLLQKLLISLTQHSRASSQTSWFEKPKTPNKLVDECTCLSQLPSTAGNYDEASLPNSLAWGDMELDDYAACVNRPEYSLGVRNGAFGAFNDLIQRTRNLYGDELDKQALAESKARNQTDTLGRQSRDVQLVVFGLVALGILVGMLKDIAVSD